MNIVAAAKRMKEDHDMNQQIENPIAEQNYSIADDDQDFSVAADFMRVEINYGD